MIAHRLFRDRAILMVCDIQCKFVPLVYGKEGVLEASSMMVKAAKTLGLPIIVTEHTKKVMGDTADEIKNHLKDSNAEFIPKTKFSMIIPETEKILKKYPERNQIILIGMQTQICILQTFLDLKQKNYDVYLPADAITSMRPWERTIALRRMEKEGGIITSFESATFDLLKDSTDQKFKDILKILKQSKREKAISHL